jgi:undecaprenyl-diphosphatase
LTAALFLGFKREEAARFSFLLGLPAIALAGLKELAEL